MILTLGGVFPQALLRDHGIAADDWSPHGMGVLVDMENELSSLPSGPLPRGRRPHSHHCSSACQALLYGIEHDQGAPSERGRSGRRFDDILTDQVTSLFRPKPGNPLDMMQNDTVPLLFMNFRILQCSIIKIIMIVWLSPKTLEHFDRW